MSPPKKRKPSGADKKSAQPPAVAPVEGNAEFSAVPIAPEVQRTMRISIWEGCATVAYMNWTAGSVLFGTMLYLGATQMQMALVASVPFLAQAASPLAAWIQAFYPRPKVLCVVGGLVARTIWLVPAFGLFWIGPEGPENVMRQQAPLILIMLILFGSIFNAGIGTIWSGWMGAVVPQQIRGRYFGLRNGIHAMVGLTANIIAGLLLDWFWEPFNFQVTMLLAVIFAWIGIYMYSMHYEPPGMVGERLNLHDTFMRPLQDKNFRKYLKFVVYWQAAVMLAAPFVYPFFISHLKLSFTQIAIYQAIAAVTTLLMGPVWGRLADRVGNKSILAISTFIAGSFLPLTWMMAIPGNPIMVYVSGVVDGFAWSAVNACLFNLALATASTQARSAYIGIMSLCTGIAGFVGGIISGPLLESFNQFEFTVYGWHWTGYHWLFLFSSIFRSTAFFLIAPIKETRSWRTRDLLKAFFSYRAVGFPWR